MSRITITIDDSAAGFNSSLDKLMRINSGKADEMYRFVGLKAEQLIKMGFAKSEDPYGKPWAPLQHRVGQILVDKGFLRKRYSVNTSGAFVSVTSMMDYASYQHDGNKNMPARKIMPDGDLPSGWERSIYSAITKWLQS